MGFSPGKKNDTPQSINKDKGQSPALLLLFSTPHSIKLAVKRYTWITVGNNAIIAINPGVTERAKSANP
jgi:hypothetical protein